MQDNQQFEQLMLQYNQLKNGAEDIKRMLENEDYDSALTMLKLRESVFLNCKCMRKYLELTPEQEKIANEILDEIRNLEKENIDFLTKGMSEIQLELKRSIQTEKIQQAYEFDESHKGSIINIQD